MIVCEFDAKLQQTATMAYSNIFPQPFTFPNALFAFLGLFLALLSYDALFEFGYNGVLEKLYGQTGEWKMVYRVQTYLLILNLPLLIMAMSGIVYNSSLLPLQVALKVDEILILVVSGYICYLQESRQTPIRGCPFLKDIVLAVVFNLALLDLYNSGELTPNAAYIALPIYLVALILQAFSNELENCVLLGLGIRERNIYRASFLLTQKSHSSNFLEIKDIISTHQPQIKEELEDFHRIASQLKRSNEELAILNNLGRLFIPIKAACQIYEEKRFATVLKDFQDNWEKGVNQRVEGAEWDDEEETNQLNSFDQSASSLILRKTITEDTVLEQQQQEKEDESCFGRMLRCVFYPLYLSRSLQGRARHFMDYLIVILVSGSMFVIANAEAYISQMLPSEQSLISFIIALAVVYPQARYFIRVSGGSNDYDFLGIFMQSITIKVVISSIALLILSLVKGGSLAESGKSWMTTLFVRCAMLFVYAVFLAWKRFAIRHYFLKVFVGVYIAAAVVEVILENMLDHMSE